MVIGALSYPRVKKARIVKEIHLIKKHFSIGPEFGWKTLSPNKKEFYRALINLFKKESDMRFRCIVVNRSSLDHEQYNYGDEELGFYKLYYQLLIHWLKPGNAYHIYLDWQQNKIQNRFVELRDILRKKLADEAKIICLEPVHSQNLPLIQLTDLFIGAVGYKWNKRNTSKTKLDFCESLAKSSGLSSLNNSTGPNFEKFNIFHFMGR